MKNVLASLLILLVAVYACRQGYENENEFVLEDAPLQPRVRGDMFHFENESDLKLFYDYLVQECERRDTSQIPFTEEWLLLFNCAYGINSRLKVDYNSDVLSEASNREEEDVWLLDEFRRALLNEDFEISVGDYVYVYLSENQIYKVQNNDMESLFNLKQTVKGDDNINPKGLSTSVELISDIKGLVSGTTTTRGGGDTYCSYKPKVISGTQNCSTGLTKGILLVLEENATLNGTTIPVHPHPAIWFVDWGDGSSTVSDWGTETELYHTYTSEGTFYIKIGYEYVDCLGQEEYVEYDPSADVTIQTGLRTCWRRQVHEIEEELSGIIKMKYELWTNNDLFGNHIVARTTRFRWEDPMLGSPRWRRDAAFVKAEINYVYRRDSDCILLESGLETDSGNSTSRKRAGKTANHYNAFSFEPYEIHSLHEVYVNPNNLVRTLSLYPCE